MTAAAYDQGVIYLQEQAPDHPLLTRLQQGQTALTERYLLQAMQHVRERENDEDEIEEQEKAADPTDETLKRLYVQKSNLFVQRAKHSNRLHDCTTDRQRVDVVDDIVEIQRAIEQVFETIRHYKTNGSLPEQEERYRIPKDTADLILLRSSLMSSISRKRKEQREIFESPESAERTQKLKKGDEKLRDLELHLSHVKTEYKRRTLQPEGLSEGKPPGQDPALHPRA